MLKVEIVGLFEWLKLRSNLDQPLICFLQDPSELSCTIQCRLATKNQQQGWPVLHVSGCYIAGLNLIFAFNFTSKLRFSQLEIPFDLGMKHCVNDVLAQV